MNRVSPVLFAGLCLVLAACGSESSDGTNDDSGGAAGSSGAASSAGAATGGASTAGSGNNETGGASETGGATNGGGEAGGGDNGGASAGGGQAGATSTGGTGGTGGSGTAGTGGAGAGTGGIDFSIWVLQLPIGSGTSPTTITSKQLLAGYSSDYFYLDKADGGQVFMDPATGITTSGSQHCRTEMRESTTSGGQAAWASSGSHTMTVRGKIVQVGGGTGGTVTVGQLFNGTDSIPLIELEWGTSIKGFKVFYEEAKGGGGSPVDVKAPAPIGSEYTFALAMNDGTATVTVNGKEVYSKKPSPAALAKKFYFKAGNYDQKTSAGAISAVPFTVVKAYSVAVVHEE